MAYAFVQQNANDAAAGAQTITVTLTPTAGNLLVFCISADQLDTTSIALSDNLGVHNTFTQIATDLVTGPGSDQRCAWYFAENCKGGATTFTATFSNAATRFRTIYVAEYSGIATSGSFLNGARQEQATPGTGTDAVSSGVANATSQPALVWGFSIDIFTNATPTAGTGFTSRAGVWSTNTCLGRPEDKRVTATGNVAATFTTTAGTDSHGTGVGIFAEAAVTPTVSSWEPVFPDRMSPRRSVSALAGAVAPVMAIALTPLSWAPSFPDRAPARPTPNLATGVAAEPVFVPAAAPPVTPMSWSPTFPDFAPRARGAQIAGGTAKPEATLPNPPAPPLSWSPVFPDFAPRARQPVNTGGMAAPVAPVPVPSLTAWAPTYVDLNPRARPRIAGGAVVPGLPIPDPPPSIFPLSVSSNGRHLRKKDGTPFLICGDSTWSLSVNLSATDQATFLDDCVSRGINSVMSNAIEHCFTVVKPPNDVGSNLPFTQRLDAASYTGSPNGTTGTNGTQNQFASDNYGSPASQSPDPTFINNTYWNRVDALLGACLSRNIAIFVWPMYLGFHGGQEGWITEMERWDAVTGAGGFTGQAFADPSKSKMWNYGAWLGARWAQYPNVIWVAGGDYGTNGQTLTAAQTAAVKSCIDGIKSQQPNALWTAHWDRPCKSDDNLISGTTWALNFCYTDDNTAEATRAAYSSAAKPAYLGENNYEDGSFGGTLPFRKYLYWGFLGGIAGGFYGQEQLWRFDDGSPGTLWSTLLTKQGRLDAARQYAFWNTKPWHRLVPNGLGGIGTLITAGGGTASPQSTDYVGAAATPEKDLLLAYVPPAHTGSVTVDMTKLGATVTARWFDPTNATFTAIGTFPNTGTHAFTTPGNNSAGEADWLLVLDAPDAPMPLSWAPTFPDRAPRRSITTAEVVSGMVKPVAPPPPSTLDSWSPTFPDFAPRARQPVNTGGMAKPEATLPNPLFWTPVFPDFAPRARQPVNTGGSFAPPTDTNAGPLTWSPSFPDCVPRPRAAQIAGGAVAPPSDTNAGPLTWSPVFPDRAPGLPRVQPGGEFAPPADTNAGPLTWLPRVTDPVGRPRPQPPGGEFAPLFTAAPVVPLSWSPSFPDLVPRARAAQIAGGMAKPEATLPNAVAPPLSWSPVFPDRAQRARQPVNVGGSFAPEATLPNPPAPPLSWSPVFPDFAPRARQPVNTGGMAKPEATLPNPPAPELSWLPIFPAGRLTRPSWTAWMLDASIVASVEPDVHPITRTYMPRPGIGRAGIRRDFPRGAGVSRTGSVRVSLPSPTGEWNPQLDDNVVDFDRDAFTRFIDDKGYSVTWEKAVLCPNVPGTGLSPRDHAIGCPFCDERGFVYVDPISTKMLMQGVRLNQSFFAYGRWDAGNMLVTGEPEFTIDYHDRLTLDNGVGRFTQRLVRQRGAVADRLKYAPLCFHFVGWVGRTQTLVQFTQDVDYRVSADGLSIEWSGASQPDAGSVYSVCYDYRPRYVVMDLVHHHRDSTIEGQHYQFPMQAVAKLDFLIRNEGADARQIEDKNPFE